MDGAPFEPGVHVHGREIVASVRPAAELPLAAGSTCLRCGASLTRDDVGGASIVAPIRSPRRPEVVLSCRNPVCLWHVATRAEAPPVRPRDPVADLALSGRPAWLPLGVGLPDPAEAVPWAVAAALAVLFSPLKDTIAAALGRRAKRHADARAADAARRTAERAREVESERLARALTSATRLAFADAPGDLLSDAGVLTVQPDERDAPRAWRDAGGLVVVIRPSDDPGETATNLLIAYVARTLLTDARRHLPETVMCAADLRLARTLIAAEPALRDARHAFDARVAASCGDDPELEERWRQVDAIDVHGWLLRILLPEFRRVGEALGEGAVRETSKVAAEEFLEWLHRLARRPPGDRSVPLTHVGGNDFRVGVVLVGDARYVARRGLRPHLERAIAKMYDEKVDVLYVAGRGKRGVELTRFGVYDELVGCERVARAEAHEFRLRPDFRKRVGLDRSRAFVGRIEMEPWEPHERPGSRDGSAGDLHYLAMRRRRRLAELHAGGSRH